MTHRIALAGLHMECASFLPHVTHRDVFEACTVRGHAVLDRFRGSNTVMGGFLSVIDAAGAEAIPILHADGGAAGLADQAAVAEYRAEIVEGLLALDGGIDGVLLHLHGAMVTQDEFDPDAMTLDVIRSAVGPDLPIMVAFDYHANLDAASIDAATAAFGYRYSPHIDMGATGERAARCLLRTLAGEIRPAMALARPGLILPSIFSATDLAPLKDLVAEAARQSGDSVDYRDMSLFAGFAYADVPNCGASVVAVVDGTKATAEALAAELSGKMAQARAALSSAAPVYGLAEGIERALALADRSSRPVVVLEHADRANDSTHGLRMLLGAAERARIAVPFLWDPGAVRTAMQAGVGGEVTLALGGHSAPLAGGPVTVRAKVAAVRSDFTYRGTGAMRAGSEVRLGDSVLLDVKGLMISVTSLSQSAIDFDPFHQFDLDPADFDIILLRSKTHFRAAWEGYAAGIVIVDTPDYGPADISALPYRHARP
ncbi:M81 family metallopeptidase [Cognatishimia sp. F0-27]|uniref:M81 family metallopeptidase n=1 Tax=Cognatishimia sp. F0-27 TaxID=2816855 RepID=UPI001D0C2C35|nr:M81 family metallopeptidase [Cognatishimia sp. F0-27]MCC1491864.1 M81 family metallopeptidase [Cognatishimia sp. F0-27]